MEDRLGVVVVSLQIADGGRDRAEEAVVRDLVLDDPLAALEDAQDDVPRALGDLGELVAELRADGAGLGASV